MITPHPHHPTPPQVPCRGVRCSTRVPRQQAASADPHDLARLPAAHRKVRQVHLILRQPQPGEMRCDLFRFRSTTYHVVPPKSFPSNIQDHEVWIWLDTDVEAVSSTLDRVVLREALNNTFVFVIYLFILFNHLLNQQRILQTFLEYHAGSKVDGPP